MGSLTLDPASLGLEPHQLAFEADDGRYGVRITHHAGAIYTVRERGYADDACGVALVALFVGLLDAVERRVPGAHIYLCSDYSDYGGSSNATRKAMLRHVVMRPTLGAVAFWGAGMVTRSVAMLLNVSLPRLSAKPFRTQEQALAYLEAQAGSEQPDLQASEHEPWGGSLDSAVLTAFQVRNAEFTEPLELGSEHRRVVRPPDWSWTHERGLCSVRLALIDDDLLLLEPRGPLSATGVARTIALLDLALADLGHREVTLVVDLRAEQAAPRELWAPRAEQVRARRERLSGVAVVVDNERESHAEINALVLATGACVGPRPVFASLELALGQLEGAHESSTDADGELELPTDRAELEQLTLRLHRERREQILALEKLFAFVGRASWDQAYLDDGLAVPDDITAANPYWSIYGALHLMQQDMQDVLRDREERNRELAAAREQAEAASLAKSQFLGTVSHELRTPLNGIFGMAALLRDSPLQGDQLRHLDGVDAASSQLARLVDDLLDITRIEAGVLAVKQQSFVLGEALQQLLERWAPVARDRHLELRSDLVADLPVRVSGDRGRLMQVLSNLLDNAIKFTERGWVSLTVKRGAGGMVCFEVRDSGCGISERDLAGIFDRFERGASGRSDVVPGAGLGLAICRQLTELMGGGIDVSSVLGQGTCFTVEVLLEPTAAAPQSPARLLPAPDQGDDFSDLLVLLAEDDPASRYVAQHLLESLGCEVVVAEDGRATLERLERGRYDLVLMDCQMPFLDGLEVTRRFRASEPPGRRTPIVALTAYAFDEDRERMLAAGMDDHEAKPINRARFQQLLRRWGSG